MKTETIFKILKEYDMWLLNKNGKYKYHYPQAARMALHDARREVENLHLQNVSNFKNMDKYFYDPKNKDNELTEYCELNGTMKGSINCTKYCSFCNNYNDKEMWISCAVINWT